MAEVWTVLPTKRLAAVDFELSCGGRAGTAGRTSAVLTRFKPWQQPFTCFPAEVWAAAQGVLLILGSFGVEFLSTPFRPRLPWKLIFGRLSRVISRIWSATSIASLAMRRALL